MPKIWVDADACPIVVRDIIARAAHKHNIAAVYVANSLLNVPESPWITFVHVKSGPDVADSYIAENAEPGDVIVSQDIPLAALVVPKGAVVVTPRGKTYTEDNINEALASRDLLSSLRDVGTISGGAKPYDENTKRQFANEFHLALERMSAK